MSFASPASAQDDMSPSTPGLLISRLSDDFLRCPRCLQRYVQPRLLVCLHAVCHACLEGLAEATAPVKPSRFRSIRISVECPVCRRLTDVTPGVDRLPVDGVRQRLLELVSLAQGQAVARSASSSADANSADVCELCSRSRPASSRCLDCGKLLCLACRQRHRRVRITSEHELVDVDRQMALRCERHKDELVRFYCTSCQIPVCIGCTFSSEHAEHTVLKFKDAAQQKADELAEFSRQSVEKLRQLKAALQLARNIEAHVTDTETAIREAASQQVSAIRSAQQTLLDELRSFYDCCAELLNGRHEIASALRDLTEVSSFSELVERGRYSESLMLAPRVADTLARYAHYQPPTPPPTPRRYRLLFVDAASCDSAQTITLGRLEMQRLTASCCFSSDSSSETGSCVDVTSLSSSDSGSSCDLAADAAEDSSQAESFFTYDNTTLRSSVCRSLTTDTLVASSVDAECQTDFFLVVQLGFSTAKRHEFVQLLFDSTAESLVQALDDVPIYQLKALHCCLELVEEHCLRYNEPDYQLLASPMTEIKRPLCTGIATWDTQLESEAALPTELSKRRSAEDEVRVCSIMFSSMESNDCDGLDAVPPPKLLYSVGCQDEEVSAKSTTTVATQTPHLPRRRDLVDGSAQTIQLALFSRDTQAQADMEERACQTNRLRRVNDGLIDRATQWETVGRSCQEFYRSGRIVRVVGGSGGSGGSGDICNHLALSPRAARRCEDAGPESGPASREPNLHQLTQMMQSKRQPSEARTPPPSTAATAAAGPSTSRPAAPSGVKFAKPSAAAKPEEALSSLDRLKNFCTRLRQRRTGLGKQKVVLFTDQ